MSCRGVARSCHRSSFFWKQLVFFEAKSGTVKLVSSSVLRAFETASRLVDSLERKSIALAIMAVSKLGRAVNLRDLRAILCAKCLIGRTSTNDMFRDRRHPFFCGRMPISTQLAAFSSYPKQRC